VLRRPSRAHCSSFTPTNQRPPDGGLFHFQRRPVRQCPHPMMHGGPVRGRRAMVPSARPIPTIGPILSSICAPLGPIRSRVLPHLSQPRSSARWRGIRRSSQATGRPSLQPRGRNNRTCQQAQPPPPTRPHRIGLTLNRSSRSSRNLLLQRHCGRATHRAACFRVTPRSPPAGCSGRTQSQLRHLQVDRSVQAAVMRRPQCRACPVPGPHQDGQHRFSRRPRAGCSGRTQTQLRHLLVDRSVQAAVSHRCRCRAYPAPRPRWGC
jgi:hypothetical protein